MNPENAGMLNSLGVSLKNAGKIDEAIACYRQALEIEPQSSIIHVNLANALYLVGRYDEAAVCLRDALRIDPNFAGAHNSLGCVLQSQGKLTEAVASFEHALRIQPNDAKALSNLGMAFARQGKLDDSMACYRQALQINPGLAEAHFNLGDAFRDREQYDRAASSYQEGLRIRPDHIESQFSLGFVLGKLSRFDEAVACFQRAVQINPGLAEAHVSLGNAFRYRGEYDKAAACYQQGLQIRPDHFDSQLSLGYVLGQIARFDEAAACLERAIQIKPSDVQAYRNLGSVLTQQGKLDEAAARYEQALKIENDSKIRFELATLLPIIPQSLDEALHYRRRLAEGVAALVREGVRFDPTSGDFGTVFPLAYQGLCDREIQESIAQLFPVPEEAARPDTRSRGRREGPIRIGFLSRHFRHHTIAKLVRGMLAQFTRGPFQWIVVSVGFHDDEMAREIKGHADQYVVAPLDPPAIGPLVADQKLDILVYTDVGMDPITLALARTRLAPIQCVMWGHPVTTGMPTIDYFISSKLLEPPGATEHYSEELVELESLPTYYDRPAASAPPGPRSEFGLADDRHVYLCPQSLFKIHPEFDATLADILQRDPLGDVILIEAHSPHLTELLRQRFRSTIPDFANRIQFQPRLSELGFLNLMAVSDVVLDPLHFGGGNSVFEAMAVGTPTVTLPAAYMRGRVAYACYRKMGILDCVAEHPDDYVDIAVRLGTNRDYRDTIRQKILSACDVLFEDIEAVRELERFFQRAVEVPRA